MENELVELPEENYVDVDKLNYDITEVRLLPLNKYIILTILTLGLYQIWWMYKAWKFFKEKDDLDIKPAARAIFTLFFLKELLDEILIFAEERNYSEKYNSLLIATIFISSSIIFNIISHFITNIFMMFAYITLSLCLIPAYKAYYFAIAQSEEVPHKLQNSFNGRQILLIILGSIWWILTILGIMFVESK